MNQSLLINLSMFSDWIPVKVKMVSRSSHFALDIYTPWARRILMLKPIYLSDESRWNASIRWWLFNSLLNPFRSELFECPHASESEFLVMRGTKFRAHLKINFIITGLIWTGKDHSIRKQYYFLAEPCEKWRKTKKLFTIWLCQEQGKRPKPTLHSEHTYWK